MSFTVSQEKFEGPLDLLLQLIQKQELDITGIALSQVTEQYLVYVEELERESIPEISDFLVIAARLILLKSRALLAEESEPEEADDLASQLAEYKLYKEAAAMFGEDIAGPRQAYGKEAALFEPSAPIVTDGVTVEALHLAFNELISRFPEEVAMPVESLEERVSLEECIQAVRSQSKRGVRPFKDLFASLSSRLAMIVTFLAVLELIKQQVVRVKMDGRELMVAAR